MGVYLNPGNDRFRRACNSEIYVDKTELITKFGKSISTIRMEKRKFTG